MLTNPEERGDPWIEALSSYFDFADQVVIVNGGKNFEFDQYERVKSLNKRDIDFTIVNLPWPDDWGMEEFPKHLNAGLKECTGDWVLKLDIDQIIHEDDFENIRHFLELSNDPIAALHKVNFYEGKRYSKGYMPMAINKKLMGNQIMFGADGPLDNDYSCPVIVDHIHGDGVPVGTKPGNCTIIPVNFWNFDYTFKTEKQRKEQFFKASMARKKSWGKTEWGETPDEAYEIFSNMFRTRLLSAVPCPISDLPKYIRERCRKFYETN